MELIAGGGASRSAGMILGGYPVLLDIAKRLLRLVLSLQFFTPDDLPAASAIWSEVGSDG
jgi:hypothetical protein